MTKRGAERGARRSKRREESPWARVAAVTFNGVMVRLREGVEHTAGGLRLVAALADGKGGLLLLVLRCLINEAGRSGES